MGWISLIGLFLIGCLVVPGSADDEKKGADFKLLSHADLKKNEGVWEMKVATEKGWKGTVRATIVLYPAGTKQEGFGYILYDCDMVRGKDKSSIRNAPGAASSSPA
ncbi:MAG TPA: hypothetical protein VHR72_06045 [Gemmataceae bacterium]|nr:hypothetical protein [Gemmataceae bacterium]